ncbi:hypothetical protein [uncultured Psychroserpens sp.]|uniref:hypothetical protein n=1 Tax=uncultured Psychroserpens sp. TaxID=255436 RepID=UPI002605A09D|nr:hypothetical protein [uncultured Psychroserpens sp.]
MKNHHIHSGLDSLQFKFRDNTIVVLINDEYQDLANQNPLLNLVLVLNELSYIDESLDFLNWCSENEVNASSEKLRLYYIEILAFLPHIKTFFSDGKIDGFISDLDFQLNAGAVQYLRSNE